MFFFFSFYQNGAINWSCFPISFFVCLVCRMSYEYIVLCAIFTRNLSSPFVHNVQNKVMWSRSVAKQWPYAKEKTKRRVKCNKLKADEYILAQCTARSWRIDGSSKKVKQPLDIMNGWTVFSEGLHYTGRTVGGRLN